MRYWLQRIAMQYVGICSYCWGFCHETRVAVICPTCNRRSSK